MGTSPQSLLAWTAETQRGYVTRAQAIRDGVDDVALHRAVAAERLQRVAHGVYRVAGAPEHPHEEMWAAWLQLDPSTPSHERLTDPGAWVTHASASRVLDLGVLAADVHQFSTVGRRQTRRHDVRFHRISRPLDRSEWAPAEGMPVAGPIRIITDLVAAGADGDHVGWVIIDALDRDLVTHDELVDALVDLEDPAAEIDAMVVQATAQFAGR